MSADQERLRREIRDQRVLRALRDLRRLTLAEAERHCRPACSDPLDHAGQLTALVASVCGCPPDSIDSGTPLFQYGLDSLGAADVRRRLERMTGRDLPPTLVFEYPTIDRIAAYLASLDDRSDNQRVPLTYGQEAVWLSHALAPSGSAYNLRCALRLARGASLDALAAAVATVGVSHPILRSRISEEGGRTWQAVDPALRCTLEIVSAVDAIDGPEAWIIERSMAPFDLERGPLARFLVLSEDSRVPGRDAILLVVVHHIVADFLSIRLLVRELSALHDAFRTGNRRVVAPEYCLYARATAERSRPRDFWDTHFDRWQSLLPRRLPVLPLPHGRTRTAAALERGLEYRQILAAPGASRVREAAARLVMTPFQLMFCVYASLLMTRFAVADVVIGTPCDGRESDVEVDAAGYFVNPVPVYFSTRGIQGWQGFLLEHRRRIEVSLALREMPFVTLVERLSAPRMPFVSPVFQTLFTMVSEAENPSGVQALVRGRVRLHGHQRAGVTHDLVLLIEQTSDDWQCLWGYRPALFEPALIESLASEYVDRLEDAARGSEIPQSLPSALREHVTI